MKMLICFSIQGVIKQIISKGQREADLKLLAKLFIELHKTSPITELIVSNDKFRDNIFILNNNHMFLRIFESSSIFWKIGMQGIIE